MQVKELMNFYSKEKIPFLIIADFELKKPIIYRLDELPDSILYDFNGNKNYTDECPRQNISLEVNDFPLEIYEEKFNKAITALKYGNSYLLNLTVRSQLDNPISLESIFYQSVARYKLLLKSKFVVFSPETFIKVEEGRIFTNPMKGTIDAQMENAEQLLLSNKKEAAEHFTIVDLLRNDLSKVAVNVKLNRLRYVDKIRTNKKHLLQLSSEISGDIKDKYLNKLGDIFFSLLPAGSISGSPKTKTIEIIQSIEGRERGYYTGVAGIYDGVKFDSTVLIRYIEKEGNSLYYRSGGGITAQSELLSEYQEMKDKIYVPIL